jgi:hypothetical protein
VLQLVLIINIILSLEIKRAYNFERRYHDGDIIHIDLAQELSFFEQSIQ